MRRVSLSVWAAVALLVLVALPGDTGAEVAERAKLRVSFTGKLSPTTLPRAGLAPVSVEVGGQITTTDGSDPPQLQGISIAVNRNGHLAPGSLPQCRIADIQPATTQGALEACRRSLVGEGSFSAKVLLPEQAPFPSTGKVYAYNGLYEGRPAILAHVYGTEPAPTSYTLPFVIGKAKGQFGTLLSTTLPQVTSQWGYVTGLSLKLKASGAAGYLTASCPAPAGFPSAVFPLARSTFSFGEGRAVGATLNRSCRVRGR